MADKKHPTATEMDYPAHRSSWSTFLGLVKWSIILVVPIVILVMILIT
ncbi:aa3-type cytochrome c oxidase subunit IV [Sphingomicrobium sediminis]|uniref:Aa3-type cytochrome c oxidase subunit IV n=1 Tax=Sphingomicrobium sediminis TaxID=2950949 RepID=A0A9X2EFS8_9SPHN|nr:aa3-type cytochrome c oxidase subunit IV [Sphingomicrobium sediminis]MCM8556596.1 aa3-type cytochrome c oxidase subunit IV [Sphingomicrobium sediminis]